MRPSRLLLFALAACGSGALTPVDSGAPPPHPPGSVTFHWTFNGGTETCASAGVESVQLYLGLRPLLRAPCLGREGQSLTVDALTESDTSWALTATSALATLTTATGRLPFQPERAQDVTVDLGFDPKTTGAVAFLWTFDHGQSCAQANVETVDVALDGRHVRFACSGVAGERGTLPGLRAGAHPFTLLGLRGGEPVMKKSGQALVTLGKTSELAVDLSRIDPAALGSLTFTWRFEVRSNAGASPLESCAAAQTETVTLQVGDEAPLTVPCLSFEAGHARSIKVPLLPPGALKYTVTGGQRKASGTAVVTAGADQAVDLRLTASSLLSGSVLLEPRFGGQSCTEAGVAQLRVQVGGLITPLDTLVACDALPWRSNGFYPASYPVTLSATGRGGIEYLASGKLMLGEPASRCCPSTSANRQTRARPRRSSTSRSPRRRRRAARRGCSGCACSSPTRKTRWWPAPSARWAAPSCR
ncbi:MAG: hypothetical protein IPJ65_21595 [Archangiaceae bacterium]|nr:hypothetical protein [Archangiaceae bacterium]